MSLSENEKARYHRQLLIPQWDEACQEKLKQSTVFVAGAGGLGSVVAYYLAVAGVGTIRICDEGLVEISNLNRQILYCESDIGKPKTSLAKEVLLKL